MDYLAQQEPNEINDTANRVRILEGKYNLTRDRMFLLNENMVSQFKFLKEELNLLKEEIKELKETNQSLKETISNLLKELDLFARKEHLKVLEKYINMWNPLSYATREEMLELLKNQKKIPVKRKPRKKPKTRYITEKQAEKLIKHHTKKEKR